MNTRILRMKNSKKGITPVIATIILIAVTLVLALVVGAYTFGLFGSNVKQITLTSGSLFAGNLPATASTCAQTGQAYISFSVNNPGAGTTITGFTLTGTALNGNVVSASYGTAAACTGLSAASPDSILGGQVSALTFYFTGTFATGNPGSTLVSGQTFNYVINFANGQSVSGVFQAQ